MESIAQTPILPIFVTLLRSNFVVEENEPDLLGVEVVLGDSLIGKEIADAGDPTSTPLRDGDDPDNMLVEFIALR